MKNIMKYALKTQTIYLKKYALTRGKVFKYVKYEEEKKNPFKFPVGV